MQEPITFVGLLGGFATLTYFIVRFTVLRVWESSDRRAKAESEWMRTMAERQQVVLENHLVHNTKALLALSFAIDALTVVTKELKQ